MEQVKQLFLSLPLPYKYVTIPNYGTDPINREKKLKYYVNKVVTDLSKRAFEDSGFELTDSENHWNMTWGRQFDMMKYSTFQSWQKSNHFAGANLMGRKDKLHCRMIELKDRLGDFVDFYPESYLLPDDESKLSKHWHDHKLWIAKKSAAARGEGITLIDSSISSPPTDSGIVQYYIEHPLLITERKFDLRIYVLVTSVAPLRMYIYNNGLARFATHKYDPNADPTNARVHLTNFSLNKDDPEFVRSDSSEENVADSKWSLPFFFKYLEDQHFDVESIKTELDRVTISSFIGGLTAVRNQHTRHVPHRQNTIELYGIDVLLDSDLHAHVMEINISPGMSGSDSPLDAAIKGPLMRNYLRMARIIDCDCDMKKPCPCLDDLELQEKHALTRQRVMAVERKTAKPWDSPNIVDIGMVRDFMEEKELAGEFRRVFPKRKTMDLFARCFDRMKYHDIVMMEWVRMNPEQRLAAVKKGWEEYEQVIHELGKE